MSLKRKFMIAILVLSFALPAISYGVNLELGVDLNDISMKSFDGTEFKLGEFEGKVVLITFWSTWCVRCTEEMEFLKENYGGIDDVVVIAVNQDSDKEINRARVKEFMDELGVDFRIVLDHEYVLWERFGINALPTSIIVDREGKVKYIEPNFYFASPQNLSRVIEELLVSKG